MNEINNNEEIRQVEKTTQVENKNGFEVADEEFDSKWENPSYDEIVAEPDVSEEAYRDEDEDFVKSWNTGASMGLDTTIDGLDTSGLADYVNENDTLVKKEIDFGYGVAESMRYMGGEGITETELFKAKSDTSDYEKMSEETPIDETISDEDGNFKVEQNGYDVDIEIDTETIEELKNQGYEVEIELTEQDVESKKSDSSKIENIEEIDEEELKENEQGIEENIKEEIEPEQTEEEKTQKEKDDEKRRNNIFNNFGR